MAVASITRASSLEWLPTDVCQDNASLFLNYSKNEYLINSGLHITTLLFTKEYYSKCFGFQCADQVTYQRKNAFEVVSSLIDLALSLENAPW